MITVDTATVHALARPVEQNTDIWDVRVIHLHARSSNPAPLQPLVVQTEVEAMGRITDSDVEVRCRYQVRAFPRPAENGEETWPADLEDEPAWEVITELSALFSARDERPEFNEAQLSAFALSSGVAAVHPYARELIQDTVGRMGYPPYTLGVMKSPWERIEGASVEVAGTREDVLRATGKVP
jgi:hypothetical protein